MLFRSHVGWQQRRASAFAKASTSPRPWWTRRWDRRCLPPQHQTAGPFTVCPSANGITPICHPIRWKPPRFPGGRNFFPTNSAWHLLRWRCMVSGFNRRHQDDNSRAPISFPPCKMVVKQTTNKNIFANYYREVPCCASHSGSWSAPT